MPGDPAASEVWDDPSRSCFQERLIHLIPSWSSNMLHACQGCPCRQGQGPFGQVGGSMPGCPPERSQRSGDQQDSTSDQTGSDAPTM